MISASPLSTWMEIGRLVGDHLWQSTLFAAAVGFLTLGFRNNRAQVRNALWLAASVKFLIPLAALVAIGGHFGWRHAAPLAQNPAPFVLDMDTMSQPFSRLAAGAPPAVVSHGMASAVPILLCAIWLCGCAVILLTWWTRWRRVAVVIRDASPVQRGPELDALRRLEAIAGITKPVALVSSNTSLEPGVFGIVNPVLLWPRSISGHLADKHVEMILAHELSHVRRRDNLAATIHMLVETLFWFHPLVWWLGARMVDERERACDEDVLRLRGNPQVYAESVLKVCEFYLESPIVCVAGVTGSNLKKRMERIMSNHVGQALNRWRKLFLATAAVAALAVPVVAGALGASRLRAQSPSTPTAQSLEAMEAAGIKMSFDVASVKQNKSGPPPSGESPYTNFPMGSGDAYVPNGGLLSAKNIPLIVYLNFAYNLTAQSDLLDLPDWVNGDRFDIEARAQGNPTKDQMRLMMQSLLTDRFRLAMHTESRTKPVYALVLAKLGKTGPQLQAHVDDGSCGIAAATANTSRVPGTQPSAPPSAPSSTSGLQLPPIVCGALFGLSPASAPGRLRLGAKGVSMALIARQLPMGLASGVGRPVFDRTGLSGTFDLSLEWSPAPNPAQPPGFTPDETGPTFTEALQEQLGLKLEATTSPVPVLVVDHVERPSPN